ncbi:MAG: hypothetical protein WDO56_09600 [Gammaproteobacteria bacterium]
MIVEKYEFFASRAAAATLLRDHEVPSQKAIERYPILEGSYDVLAEASEALTPGLMSPASRLLYLLALRERLAAKLERGDPVPIPQAMARAVQSSRTVHSRATDTRTFGARMNTPTESYPGTNQLITGTLLARGPGEHEGKPSYFAARETAWGERVIWSASLERAFLRSNLSLKWASPSAYARTGASGVRLKSTVGMTKIAVCSCVRSKVRAHIGWSSDASFSMNGWRRRKPCAIPAFRHIKPSSIIPNWRAPITFYPQSRRKPVRR